MWDGIVWGAGIAAFNGVGTLLVVRWSMDKGNAAFMMAILGGMFVRLLLIGGASILVLKFAGVDPVWYLASLVVLFLVFLGLEILMVLRAARRGAGEKTG